MMEHNYTIHHIFNGHFNAVMDGETKEIGSSLRGMIKYTYFEDDEGYPLAGWSVDYQTLLKDYNNKILKDFKSGKLKEDIDKGSITLT